MAIRNDDRSKVTTLFVVVGSVFLLLAMAFIGWALHEVADENKRLHRQHQSDSALIVELTTQISGKSVPAVPSPSPGKSPEPAPNIRLTGLWARPVLQNSSDSGSGRVISTGPR